MASYDTSCTDERLKKSATGICIPSVIKNQGFVNAIGAEVERIQKLQLFSIDFSVTGEEKDLGEDRQLILYRICQELLHNVVKHAQPRSVKLLLEFEEQQLNIRLADDGVGFNPGEAASKAGASGMTNLNNRARLIGGSLYLNSALGKGTDCFIQIPYS